MGLAKIAAPPTLISAILALLCVIGGAGDASAAPQKRYALVIGNSTYRDPNWLNLRGPSNDAEEMAKKLAQLGFTSITLMQDSTKLRFEQALERFLDQIGPKDMAVLFYSGHGFSALGRNYLIPVDMASEIDKWTQRDWDFNAISINDVINKFKTRASVSLFFLNNCLTPKQNMEGFLVTKKEKENTLIAYANSSREFGLTARDASSSTPYAQSIIDNLSKGIELRVLMQKIAEAVSKATNSSQHPTWEDWLPKDAIYLAGEPASVAPPVAGRKGKRFAMVIGNADYRDPAWGKLTGPEKDAAQLARKFQEAGFETSKPLLNATRQDFWHAFERFIKPIRPSDIALIYYAGHGYSHDVIWEGKKKTVNYLIPVDMPSDVQPGIRWEEQAIAIDQIIGELNQKGAKNILILNNCKTMISLLEAFVVQQRPLQKQEKNYYDYFISYGTAPGQWAVALTPGNPAKTTPYAAALLDNMATKGIELRELMQIVQNRVVIATNAFQKPTYDDWLSGKKVYLAGAPPVWKKAWFWTLLGSGAALSVALGLGFGLQDRRPMLEPRF